MYELRVNNNLYTFGRMAPSLQFENIELFCFLVYQKTFHSVMSIHMWLRLQNFNIFSIHYVITL